MTKHFEFGLISQWVKFGTAQSLNIDQMLKTRVYGDNLKPGAYFLHPHNQWKLNK